jgi:hypothetical protein
VNVMPTQRIAVICVSSDTLFPSTPKRAIILRRGNAMKVNTQMFMQNLYSFAMSKFRKRVGIKNNWNEADVHPEIARA